MTDQTIRRLIVAVVVFCTFLIVYHFWIALGPD
jgi:hypothetical protein